MRGSEYGGVDSVVEQVDLPVAIEPVRPMMRMMKMSPMNFYDDSRHSSFFEDLAAAPGVVGLLRCGALE